MAELESFRQDVQSLIRKFEQDKHDYLSQGYPEAPIRAIDFTKDNSKLNIQNAKMLKEKKIIQDSRLNIKF